MAKQLSWEEVLSLLREAIRNGSPYIIRKDNQSSGGRVTSVDEHASFGYITMTCPVGGDGAKKMWIDPYPEAPFQPVDIGDGTINFTLHGQTYHLSPFAPRESS